MPTVQGQIRDKRDKPDGRVFLLSSMAAPFRFETFRGTGLAIARRREGKGEATVELTHLAFTFPLKLISPRSASRDAIRRIGHGRHTDEPIKPVSSLYVVGYGGGLVSGDAVCLDVDVGEGCTMLLLTQGSTKVYKMRGSTNLDTITSQSVRAVVRADSTMVVLPDPVTCFASARYSQTQRFDLRHLHTSSLILLDWFTSGRVHLRTREGGDAKSERWAFQSYASRNEVRIGDKEEVARDVLLLEQTDEEARQAAQNGVDGAIARKCRPYGCYATLILVGRDTLPLITALKTKFHSVQQLRHKVAADVQSVLWSCSRLTSSSDSADGLIVRIAGLTTENVRHWLRDHLRPVEMLIGDDLYRQALG